MKIPKINWIPFYKNNPPCDLYDEQYLVLLREDNYDNGSTWKYSVDIGEPYSDYIDDFWGTSNDWLEGQVVEVIAYAEFPYCLKESELLEDE